MPNTIPTVIMLAARGKSPAESWVGEGRLAAACDLVARLLACGTYDPILTIAEDHFDEQALVALGAKAYQRPKEDFHFGSTLAQCIHEKRFEKVAYFGGASAPLLTQPQLQDLYDRLLDSEPNTAIANNLHSTDWMLCNQTSAILHLEQRLPADNPLGWVLSQEGGVIVQSEPPSAATRLDIDTPLDLVMLRGHQAVGSHMQGFLESIPEERFQSVEAVKRVLQTPAQTLALIGRTSSDLWQRLERQTQIWVRVFGEERGMIASQRLARGEVRSLIAEMVQILGPQAFIHQLAGLADAVVWDTRVWMAATIGWPSSAERFAADLGWVDQIGDDTLRQFSHAIVHADIPILAGGYGVVSGGMYALLESLPAE